MKVGKASIVCAALVAAFLAGCRVPVKAVRERSDVRPATIERAVVFYPDRYSAHETRDPRLIARLLAGLREASRPRDDQTREGFSRFYLVPYRGKPLGFWLMLERAEVHYGPKLAAAVGDLLKTRPKPLGDAVSDLSTLEKASR